jgi:hypothetical protein
MILGHRPILAVEQTCPWIPKWKLYTLGSQILAAEPTAVSVDKSKQ